MESKSKTIIIVIVILSAIGLGIITGFLLMNQPVEKDSFRNDIQLKENLNFEIHSDIKISSLLDKTNEIKPINQEETIDTSILGKKKSL